MSLKHENDEAAELLSLQEFEDIKKQMEFSFASCISKDVEMPTFIVDLEGRVTSTRCESCFAKRKLSYDKSASEFKQVTMNFIYLPPGQSPMGVRSVREVSLFFLLLNHVRHASNAGNRIISFLATRIQRKKTSANSTHEC